MISRFLLALGLSAILLVGSTTTFMYLGARHSKTLAAPEKPTSATPRPHQYTLPGTLYVAQSGALYSLIAGRFHQLTPEAGWSMPSVTPDGDLLAVKYGGYWSDVWVVSPYGSPLLQVTFNQSRSGMIDPSLNHWAFYPRLSPDGKTLWLTYDGLKCDGCYDVSPAIYSLPYGGGIKQARAWTDGGNYTGGDQQPLPLASGAVIYTKYDFASNIDYNLDNKLVGMLWYTNRPNAVGRALTGPAEDCREPAMSPDGTQIAMICTYEKQISYLTIASWDGTSLGPRRTIISDQLVAQPIWAPDGSGIAYLAPAVAAGPFQLWFLPKAAYTPPVATPVPSPTPGGPHNGPLPSPSPTPAPPPVKPIQLTMYSGFDATSPMAWLP